MGRIVNRIFRLLGAVPPDEMRGITLTGPAWEVAAGDADPEIFFRSLPQLLPDDAILAFEGGGHPPQIRDFFKRQSIEQQTAVALGTIWPRQSCRQVPATRAILLELSELMKTCDVPDLCFHLHIYQGAVVLLQWHDAFDLPLYVSKALSEELVAAFCRELNVTFKSAG